MIEQEQVNAALAALERAKDLPPVKSYSTKKEAVEAMREQIGHLHSRGWSVSAIAKVISDAGIQVTPATVNGVIKPRTRRGRKKNTSVAASMTPQENHQTLPVGQTDSLPG